MKSVLAFCLIIVLSACRTTPKPEIFTVTPLAEVLITKEIPKTLTPSEVPTTVPIEDVVARVEVKPQIVTEETKTAQAATVIIAKKPKQGIKNKLLGKTEYVAYVNDAAKTTVALKQPKMLWWEWPLFVFWVVLIGAFLWFSIVRYIFGRK